MCTLVLKHLQSTLSFWCLHSASELQQDGDTGGTVASLQPGNRWGVEWANYYTPFEHFAFDFDMACQRRLKIPHFAGRKFPHHKHYEPVSVAPAGAEPSAAFWRVLGVAEAGATETADSPLLVGSSPALRRSFNR